MKQAKNLFFVGDSLTVGFDWQKRFPDYYAINLGVAGEAAEGLLYRMDRILIIINKPDFIFIMTGINNIAMGDYNISNIYRQIIEKLSAGFRSSCIVIQSILPVNLPWINNKAILEQNELLREIAEKNKATYLDIYSFYFDSHRKLITKYLLDDGVHVSDEGYKVWSKKVEDFLESTEIH